MGDAVRNSMTFQTMMTGDMDCCGYVLVTLSRCDRLLFYHPFVIPPPYPTCSNALPAIPRDGDFLLPHHLPFTASDIRVWMANRTDGTFSTKRAHLPDCTTPAVACSGRSSDTTSPDALTLTHRQLR